MTDKTYRLIIAVDIQADTLTEAYSDLYDALSATCVGATPLQWESTDEAYGPDGLEIDLARLAEARLAKLAPTLAKTQYIARLHEAFRKQSSKTGLWIVRVFDGFDTQWCDCTKPLSEEMALSVWMKKTANGTKQTNFSHIDYYAIFPSDMEMEYAGGRGATD